MYPNATQSYVHHRLDMTRHLTHSKRFSISFYDLQCETWEEEKKPKSDGERAGVGFNDSAPPLSTGFTSSPRFVGETRKRNCVFYPFSSISLATYSLSVTSSLPAQKYFAQHTRTAARWCWCGRTRKKGQRTFEKKCFNDGCETPGFL